MGLSHVYRNVKNARPDLSLEDARAFAVYLLEDVRSTFFSDRMHLDIEPNRQLATYAEGFRNINRTFGKMGSRLTALFDIENYGKAGLEIGHKIHIDNVRLSSPAMIRKLRLNSEFPRFLRWPCSGESLRSTPIKLDRFLSSDDLEDLRTYDPRQAYIDRMMDKRHRDWQEQNGLAPSPRERFDKLVTSMSSQWAKDSAEGFLSEQQRREILGTPYGAHTLETHTNCKYQHCSICDGGLAYCKVCGGAEASLPTECPGEKMSAQTADDVVACRMDFKGGKWIKTQDDPK